MRLYAKRWLLALGVATLLAVSYQERCRGADNAEKSDEYYELMRKFVDTFEQIERNYVKEVDRRELMEAAVRGMISKLDQYSNYISREDIDRFNQQVEQQFGGIGIQVHVDEKSGRLMVMTPLPGTPAYKGGVRACDLIMEVEGESTKGMTLSQAVGVLKGKAGTAVTIGVQHEGESEIEQITIVRAVIQISTVLGDSYNSDDTWNFMFDNERKMGFVRLTHFSRRSADELRVVLDQLRSKKMKGLILDLRFNPGGLLSQATEISDMFIEDGKIVSTQGRNSPGRVWRAKKKSTYSGFPMAVLVNRYSASASEIVSACLQDHKRAIIVGERTWGKGSVQNVIELEGGSSALKLTTANYHRPSGKNIHRSPEATESDDWGVIPDDGYRIRFSREEMRKHLKHRADRDVLTEEGPPESDYADRHLQKAVEYLIAQIDQAQKPSDPKTDKKEIKSEKSKGEKKEAKSPLDDNGAASVPRFILIPRSLAG